MSLALSLYLGIGVLLFIYGLTITLLQFGNITIPEVILYSSLIVSWPLSIAYLVVSLKDLKAAKEVLDKMNKQ